MTKRINSSGEKEVRAVQQLPQALAGDNPGDALHGCWKSEKGECTIGKDPVTARLSYTEPVGDGSRVHGWLDPVAAEESLWHGTLVLLKAGEGPWYGPSFGPPPEVVGDIKVRLLKGDKPGMETQIRMQDEEDWSELTKFELEVGAEQKPMPTPDLSNLLPMEERGETRDT
eukprot:CAMPEP_0114646496 /NCGR_PEP_ID=MMETSP0191-20121206/5210_1 /TAXON_ID=126664 /ORGANISM="Sorites sp." /LENGTH=170 /DNA_ID=CAMNT_0001859385 /DNA_START=27 /DNA_END=539 /DNA_ORIENTATION=+